MLKFAKHILPLAVACILPLSAQEPLQKVNAYSLQIGDDLRPKPGHFPIGILGDHGFTILPFMGLTMTERSHCCYEFLNGKPCTYPASGNKRGLYFFNVWAAHSAYNSKNSKQFGTLKTAVNDAGKPYTRHMLNLFDKNTRDYVFAAAASTVKTVVERDGGNVLHWGIDNEWELPLDYSTEARAAFVPWLEKTYSGDLKKFNLAWGINGKSFRDAIPPKIEEYTTRPGAWLDWRRFQEENYAGFIRDYFKAVQDSDPLKRPVVSKSTQCTIEMQATVRNRSLNHEILADMTRDVSQGWYGIDQYGNNDRNAYEMNYLYHCILPLNPAKEQKNRHGIFLAEGNNHAGPGRQFAQSYWRLLGNGLKGVDFFVLGYFGAVNDYSTFGMTFPDGTRRSRFYYLTRLANAIHRSEQFWHDAAPAQSLSKIAILMPQRDVLLANNTELSWWDFSTNNRLNVFMNLRNMGYWVDVIPYGKLAPEYLSRYRALFLVGAEHLSAKECANIAEYVKNGGHLFADMRAGFFDEHHIENRGLESLLGLTHKGIYKGIEVSPDDLWYNSPEGRVIRADGKILAELKTAEHLNAADQFENAKTPMITRNKFGKGSACWYSTRLGTLRPEYVDQKVVSEWFAAQLMREGVNPGYAFSGASEKLRVEQPLTDKNGNCAIIVAGITSETVPAGKLTVDLPQSNRFKNAFWASAEDSNLEKIDFKQKDDKMIFALPAIKSAGVIHLFPNHAPLLGMSVESRKSVSVDSATPEVLPGEKFSVTVKIINPADTVSASSKLNLKCLAGWKVSPQTADIASLKPGEIRTVRFEVTPPSQSNMFIPNYVYPLLAELERDGTKTALCNKVVSIKTNPMDYENLLTDNQPSYRFPRPYAIRTGAEYKHDAGSCVFHDPNGALIKGYNRLAKFHSDKAILVFDLKNTYSITKLGFYMQKNNPVKTVSVQVSANGKTFRNITCASPVKSEDWIFVPADGSSGRYVRISLEFKNGKNNLLDEVEIYGKPLSNSK